MEQCTTSLEMPIKSQLRATLILKAGVQTMTRQKIDWLIDNDIYCNPNLKY